MDGRTLDKAPESTALTDCGNSRMRQRKLATDTAKAYKKTMALAQKRINKEVKK
jgi:hypothetical protein